MKEIKQTFTRYYNKIHGRRRYFWGDRFKSVIDEYGETHINLMAYMDINPVRAGMVDRPEAYRWCSLSYHVQTGNKDKFLSLDFGLVEFGEKNEAERMRLYCKFVYETGAVDSNNGRQINENIVQIVILLLKRNFSKPAFGMTYLLTNNPFNHGLVEVY